MTDEILRNRQYEYGQVSSCRYVFPFPKLCRQTETRYFEKTILLLLCFLFPWHILIIVLL